MASAQAPNWSVDSAGYPFSMNVTAHVYVDGVLPNSTEPTNAGNVLGAFVGEEVRGVAAPTLVGDKLLYFLTVHGAGNGENVVFRLFDAVSDEIISGEQKLSFLSNAIWGTPGVPYRLDFGEDPAVNDPALWDVNPAQFALSMSVTAQIYLDGEEAGASGVQLAAFVGNEVRGLADPESVSKTQGEALFFLTIYSNVEGETITLRVVNPEKDSVYVFGDALVFENNAVLGDPEHPFIVTNGTETSIDAGNNTGNDAEIFESIVDMDVFPNPAYRSVQVEYITRQSSIVRFTVFDLLGRQIRSGELGLKAAGSHRTQWDLADDDGHVLASGVYFLQLATANQIITRRLVVQ